MQSQSFYYRQRMIRINFDFCRIVRKNKCDTTFHAYKISNSVVNSIIFFSAKQCSISSSIINSYNSVYFIESNLQRF